MELKLYREYALRVGEILKDFDLSPVHQMSLRLKEAWDKGKRVYICGNGGSAANAMHMANDFLYGIGEESRPGLRVTALTADTSILTCLANDEGYAAIFSKQLAVKGEAGDVLIVLSGSGNSMNVVNAIQTARELKMSTVGILGFSGGKCLDSVEIPIHFKVEDMQVAEDMQLIVGHMVMKWLRENARQT